MKTIDNKFEIGEEYYTYARENVEEIIIVQRHVLIIIGE